MKSQSEKQKILYVITQGTWGGAQRYVFDLSSKINQDFSVSVAVGEPNTAQDLQNKLKNNPSKIFQLQHLRRAINPYHDILAIVQLNSSKAGIFGSLAGIGLKNKPKIIYTVHGWVFHESRSWFIKKLYLYLEKWTALLKDAIIVLSPQEKNDAEKILHIPTEKLTVIPIGIAPPQFLPKKEAREKILTLAGLKNNDDFLIGTIANLYKNKGLDILIAAAKIMMEKNSLEFSRLRSEQAARDKPTVHFFIIGSGHEETNLRNLITAQKSNNVHLLGNYDNAAELLPAFDLFVLPSRKEGLPYTILEAMAADLPIVATRVGGLPSLTNHYTQLELTDPNNATTLANVITDNINRILSDKKSIILINSFSNSLLPMISKTTVLYNKLFSFSSGRTGR